MKLNQVIAILQTVKANTTKAKTGIYHLIQKSAMFQGISRTFQPVAEDGFVYPPENQTLQMKAEDLLSQFEQACAELFNLCATQDWANAQAKADIVVDGTTILREVPVSYLLFLEKQLVDVKTFISTLPVLDTSESWVYDQQQECFATEPKHTTKTKKIVKPVVLYEATKEHPAQVKESSEDVPEGTWRTVKFSGAISQARQNELLRRVDRLMQEVVFAREQANSLEVTQQNQVARSIFGYLFSPSTFR
ncbi:MAG: hypothetical protein RMY64_31440 [Nostoc sp. DedQUE08]|uniref:DUF7873 family protein n=1 Tax=unclassified Nostoc TaxID=2593658 RepID=UPI002AD3FB95|nr:MULTISPECIES: hypothetical protein [unclassified Nostoc]MDZ8048717.1 hypothetical protein [Nostoc sp. DedQUE02]MDZ8031810.1 hypothetical protein [Nostoc sp. DedSLP04]MDZ8070071.1 hypothetical protein [Nostoc sp. DedQUE08]MDZ8096386.1 hypothetical protein [Nostoc sp. DedQUE05]MDZ8129839.1 hypothetical protein [Nostoc sp. DedQUE07]